MLQSGTTRHQMTEQMRVKLRRLIFTILFLVAVRPMQAQTNCGIVDSVNFPVDPTAFSLMQPFAAANPRHEGRFHTGEDWYGGRGTSYGQPVRAAARGRVTYSNATAWGSDGGVVILEHELADSADPIYTVYGHIQPTPTMPFPERLACVEAGDIIGSVADVRPAPHVHFEVRVNDPDTPGAGYMPENPYSGGWRMPSQFVVNQQLWMQRAHDWHLLVDEGAWAARRGPVFTPLILNDNSILYLDSAGTTLRRATSDGRILWRIQIDPAVGITANQGQTLVIFADGRVNTLLDFDTGRLGEGWRLDAQFTGAPMTAFGWLIFPAANNALIAIDEDRRNVLWRVENVPPFVRYHVAGNSSNFTIAGITAQHELIYLSGSGGIIDRKPLNEMAGLTSQSDGTLLVYSRGGLWRVGLDGTWELAMPDVPPGGAHSAALMTEGGRLFLFDGTTLRAYGVAGEKLWEVALGVPLTGWADLRLYDTHLLLTSTGGTITAFNDGGRMCNRTTLYGHEQAKQWQALGEDGVLRIAIADQILGLDWAEFVEPCG
jgi:hypothetical protein